jgi:hypothetical protein
LPEKTKPLQDSGTEEPAGRIARIAELAEGMKIENHIKATI